jgi:hypothetical protein
VHITIIKRGLGKYFSAFLLTWFYLLHMYVPSYLIQKTDGECPCPHGHLLLSLSRSLALSPSNPSASASASAIAASAALGLDVGGFLGGTSMLPACPLPRMLPLLRHRVIFSVGTLPVAGLQAQPCPLSSSGCPRKSLHVWPCHQGSRQGRRIPKSLVFGIVTVLDESGRSVIPSR